MAIFAGLLSKAPNPTWSTLRRLGQSRIIGLTVLVPFLGWLIIFNAAISKYLDLVPEVSAFSTKQSNTLITPIVVRRLYWTYFGLLNLGAASFIFLLFCPKQIKFHGDALSFVSAEREITTDIQAASLLQKVASFQRWNQIDDSEYGSWKAALKDKAYPQEMYLDFEALMNALFREIEGPTSPDSDDSVDAEFDNKFRTAMDTLIVDEFVDMISAQRRVERNLVMSVAAEAPKYKVEILSLFYDFNDFSKPQLRLLTALFYAIGFVLLSVPTFATMWNVGYAWWSS